MLQPTGMNNAIEKKKREHGREMTGPYMTDGEAFIIMDSQRHFFCSRREDRGDIFIIVHKRFR